MARRIAVLSSVALCAAVLAGGTAMAGNDLFGPRKMNAPLTVEQAFRVLPPQRNGDRLRIEWDIAPGYYLYRSRIEVGALAPAGVHLGTLQLPRGDLYHDDHFGAVEIYRDDLVANADGAAKVTRLRVRYQGCADIGICYPPQELELDVTAGTAP